MGNSPVMESDGSWQFEQHTNAPFVSVLKQIKLVHIHIPYYTLKNCSLVNTKVFRVVSSFEVSQTKFIQSVPGGMDKTSGECSLC